MNFILCHTLEREYWISGPKSASVKSGPLEFPDAAPALEDHSRTQPGCGRDADRSVLCAPAANDAGGPGAVSAGIVHGRTAHEDSVVVVATKRRHTTRQRPMILAGHGVLIAEATQQLHDLAEKASIPIWRAAFLVGAEGVKGPLASSPLRALDSLCTDQAWGLQTGMPPCPSGSGR